MYRKLLTFTKKVLALFIVAIFAFSGCGQSNNPYVETVDNYISEGSNINLAENENIAEDNMDNEDDEIHSQTEVLPEPLQVPLNTQEEEIYYISKDDLNPLLSIHRCKSDGKNIYLVYGDPYLYVMPIGADELSPANIDNPGKMNICHIAIDVYGRIHLIVADPDFEEWYIWLLDEEYQIEKIIDITAYFEVKQMPHWFQVDKNGTYYLQWFMSRDGIIIDSEGELKHRFSLKSLETKWTYEAAAGRDGQIYLVYYDGDEIIKIGRFDMENCIIERENSSLGFSHIETFSEMFYGTDTKLLLFSPNSGVWAYDSENEVLENRVPISDIHFNSKMEFWPLTFLPDGRLFLLGRTGNDIYFKYLPVGK